MNVEEILARRRNRIIATILSYKEKEIDEYLPKEVQVKFRKILLDQINDLHELYCDMAKVNAEEIVLNELFYNKLEEIHADLRKTNA